MRARIWRWTHLAFEFAISQGLAQAAGLVSGLIYVRYMTVDQYALYALSLGSLSFVSVGSDLGLTGSLSYFWRQSAQDGSLLAPKIAIVQRLRSVFLIVTAAVCGVLFYNSSHGLRAPAADAALCFALVVATASTQIQASVGLQLMRLTGALRQSYFCEAGGSLVRLIVALAMIASGLGSAWFGLAGGLCGGLAILAGVHVFGRVPDAGTSEISAADRSDVARYLLPVLPGVLVFMIQEPLILWLTATQGGRVPVSEAFAIGRIAAVFALAGNFIIMVVTPRLAAILDDAHFVRMAGVAAVIIAAVSVVALGFTRFFPAIPLLLIGQKYAHLEQEVLIGMTTACSGMLLTLFVLANRLRGWVRLDPVVAALQITVIAVLVRIWSFADTASVLSLSMTLSLVSLAAAVAVTACGIWRPALVRARP